MKLSLRWALLPLTAALAFGCDRTEECEKLELLVTNYESTLAGVRERAAIYDRVKKRADEMEASTKKRLGALGLDLAEAELAAVLEKRVNVLGGKIERDTRVIKSDDPAKPGGTETIWRIEVEAKNLTEVKARLEKLVEVPPLFRLVAVLKGSKPKQWRVEVGRASADQLPIKFEAMPAPSLKPADEIPSQLGMCGAGNMRERLAELKTEIDALAPKAGEVTVLLPTAASWEGLERRAQLTHELEVESRRLVMAFLDAVDRSGVPLKAVGVEDEVVLVEVLGGPKERTKLMKAMDAALMAGVRDGDTQRKGVVRLLAANRVASTRRRPGQKGADEHGEAKP